MNNVESFGLGIKNENGDHFVQFSRKDQLIVPWDHIDNNVRNQIKSIRIK